jgi:hypothetical protein
VYVQPAMIHEEVHEEETQSTEETLMIKKNRGKR